MAPQHALWICGSNIWKSDVLSTVEDEHRIGLVASVYHSKSALRVCAYMYACLLILSFPVSLALFGDSEVTILSWGVLMAVVTLFYRPLYLRFWRVSLEAATQQCVEVKERGDNRSRFVRFYFMELGLFAFALFSLRFCQNYSWERILRIFGVPALVFLCFFYMKRANILITLCLGDCHLYLLSE